MDYLENRKYKIIWLNSFRRELSHIYYYLSKILKEPSIANSFHRKVYQTLSTLSYFPERYQKIYGNKNIRKIYEETSEDSIYKLFIKGVEENHIDLKNPEVTLFMIIELVSSTCFNSILYDEPLPINEYKPYLYDTIRNMIRTS